MKPPHRSASEHMSTAVLHAHASDGRRSASLPFKNDSSTSHRGVLRLCAAASHGHSEQRARIKRLLSRALERCLVGTASTVSTVSTAINESKVCSASSGSRVS